MIAENMNWPINDLYRHKLAEHDCWYTGEPDLLANFYEAKKLINPYSLIYKSVNKNTFWSRQIGNSSSYFLHCPLASDISNISATSLFGESPLIRYKSEKSEEELNNMLIGSDFYNKIAQGAEICSALGGVYIKISYDIDLSIYPILQAVSPELVFPTFKFGMLQKADILVSVYEKSENEVFRLFERYEKGQIINLLYKGTNDNIGKSVELTTIQETSDLQPVINLNVDELLIIYVPNRLPNRLTKTSPYGRSDYQGCESFFDAIDETFSAWMLDVQIARGRLHVPNGMIKSNGDSLKFNIDALVYQEIEDVNPLHQQSIHTTQFDIRAEQFEKTAINLINIAVSISGYSLQSFGLGVDGKAESGVALNIRERKTMQTTAFKQTYWEQSLLSLLRKMILIQKYELRTVSISDEEINLEFADSVSNNIQEVATTVKMLNEAIAISNETKIRMVHPEWTNEQIQNEVLKIQQENSVEIPDVNLDFEQMKYQEDIQKQGE